jgi:molybdate transport system substrate-binding protein
MYRRLFNLIILASVLLGGLGLRAAEINVYAAASLTDSLKEIAAGWEKQSGDKIHFSFGASSTLARQIQEGAPADLFFSADEAKMDALDKAGRIVKETRQSRLGNSLVVVVGADSSLTINSLANLTNASIKRLALADPKTVPAGIYSRECLEKLKLWSAIEPKVVPTDNVRAALAAVESGNVEAGMVYKTDAAISTKVKVAYQVPAADSPEISYPLALVKDAPHSDAAHKFLDYLDSDAVGKIFEKYGFVVHLGSVR